MPRGPRTPPGASGRRINGWRVARWVVLVALGWALLSLVVFVVSATLHQDSFSGTKLDSGGFPPFGTTTILVLGSDARPKGSKEPGAHAQASRADTIMLLRIGGGHNAKLSIPRDTVAAIPGHGQSKINAAYAFGGTALMVDTVRQFLGVPIDHVIEIDFQNFPKLIDAMGGIDYTGSCVVARINGGARNGGVTLRLHKGTTHIDGKHALALARVRENLCNKRENDLTRARRQQKILSAMKSRALSFSGFVRGPFIGWSAPQAIKTDMAGPTLLGVATALATSGNASPHVLRPNGATVLPDGGQALTVTDARMRAAVRAFLGD
jgi:LCP family protein required for cell wall assembly